MHFMASQPSQPPVKALIIKTWAHLIPVQHKYSSYWYAGWKTVGLCKNNIQQQRVIYVYTQSSYEHNINAVVFPQKHKEGLLLNNGHWVKSLPV